jgi:hypothetical protein
MSSVALSNAVGSNGVTLYVAWQALRAAGEAESAVDRGFEALKSPALAPSGQGAVVDCYA